MSKGKLFNIANMYIMKQVLVQLALLGTRATLKLLLSLVEEMYNDFIQKNGDKIEFRSHKEELEFKAYFQKTWQIECKKASSNSNLRRI